MRSLMQEHSNHLARAIEFGGQRYFRKCILIMPISDPFNGMATRNVPQRTKAATLPRLIREECRHD